MVSLTHLRFPPSTPSFVWSFSLGSRSSTMGDLLLLPTTSLEGLYPPLTEFADRGFENYLPFLNLLDLLEPFVSLCLRSCCLKSRHANTEFLVKVLFRRVKSSTKSPMYSALVLVVEPYMRVNSLLNCISRCSHFEASKKKFNEGSEYMRWCHSQIFIKNNDWWNNVKQLLNKSFFFF